MLALLMLAALLAAMLAYFDVLIARLTMSR
jgi:hypothetical protein